MEKKAEDRITDLLHSMDSTDLINAIRKLQNDIGDKRILDALESVSSSKTDFDPETISEIAKDCADMDDREWYSCASNNGYGGYIDPGEHAADLILDNLQSEFNNDLKQIVTVGDEEAAAEFLRAIADGLDEANGILAEESGDFIQELADHIRECADNGKFDEALEW